MTSEKPIEKAQSEPWLRYLSFYAAFLTVLAMAITSPSTSLVDGNTYFEMAKQMTEKGSFVFPNGFEHVYSTELWLGNTVEIGNRLIAKYPPIYSLISVPFYLFFGIRGLVLMNALACGFLVIAFFLIARRYLDVKYAFFSALVLPFVTPVFAYSVVVVPHLLAATFLLWSLKYYQDALEDPGSDDAYLMGVASGIAGGMAVGIRLQIILPLAVFLIVLFRQDRPRRAFTGMLTGILPCLLTMSVCNVFRFGSPNPLSYGPKGHMGSPIDIETSAFIFQRPGYLAIIGLALLVFFVFRYTSSHPKKVYIRSVSAALVACVIVFIPAFSEIGWEMSRSAFAMLFDPSAVINRWAQPVTFHALIYKSLIQASPFLILGLCAAVWHCLLGTDSFLNSLGISILVVIGFLSTRHLDITDLGNVLGIAAYGTRYLVEIYVLLFLLSCHSISRLPFGRNAGYIALFVGGFIFWNISWSEPYHNPLAKRLFILYGAWLMAALLLLGYYLWRRFERSGFLSALVLITASYSAGLTITQETRTVTRIMEMHQGWIERLDPVLPQKLAMFGWDAAIHGVFPVREKRDVIMVDVARDKGQSMERILDAFTARKIPTYYFGLRLNRVRHIIERKYKLVRVLYDPMLWKIEPR